MIEIVEVKEYPPLWWVVPAKERSLNENKN
jgi:hypothetical protein